MIGQSCRLHPLELTDWSIRLRDMDITTSKNTRTLTKDNFQVPMWKQELVLWESVIREGVMVVIGYSPQTMVDPGGLCLAVPSSSLSPGWHNQVQTDGAAYMTKMNVHTDWSQDFRVSTETVPSVLSMAWSGLFSPRSLHLNMGIWVETQFSQGPDKTKCIYLYVKYFPALGDAQQHEMTSKHSKE